MKYLVIVFAVLFSAGCQFEGRYLYSSPKIDSGEDIRVDKGRILLTEVEIWLLSQNRKGEGSMLFPVPIPMDPGDDFSAPFRMIVSITPKSDGFSFDPGQLYLWKRAGEKWVPQRIKSGTHIRSNVLLGRIPPSVAKAVPLQKDVSTTLTLEFDILPPDPNDTFMVEFGGLSLFGQPYKVPRLRFEKDIFSGPLR